ncbi:ParA family protein [Lichenifustis flavocetrariae]|uniref:ParA family protein n=1 Tax=Lichenifustis flavocetrariae TaxID=2949735 RepID=A0AA41ZAH1_9HYPH|nr:ParA family protein [Lichenifustis flavocetrariae]MCW6513270.1 ParA family protein [Lichenifustis flavocetrariae]
MRTVTLATQKGGSGKSTLAACLAVAAHGDGLRTAVLDSDPQGSLDKWANRRDAEAPHVEKCEPHELDAKIKALRKLGFGLCLIDTAGVQNTAVVPAIQVADLCLVPVKPTLTDLEAAVPTAKQLRDRKKQFAFVMSQCFGNANRLNDVAAALLKHGEVAPANVFQRVDYPDALTGGLGVTEYNPSGAAAKEVRLLWAWLRRVIGEQE